MDEPIKEQEGAPDPVEERTADAVFAELIERIMRHEPFDAEELLRPVRDQAARERLRVAMRNYQQRASPAPGGHAPRGPAPRSVEQRGDEIWLGKFRILGELGRGGMGVVYLAQDTALNRKVALKVLPDSMAEDERVVKRFLREAEAAARLRHPNIIAIHLAGEVNGTYYYSMEYVPGIAVSELLRALRAARFSDERGTLSVRRIEKDGEQVLRLMHRPVEEGRADFKTTRLIRREIGHRVLSFDRRNYVREAIALFAQVADALEYAHAEGIVHRDIKPSNLILAPDGRFMLADFGLAKIGGAQSITRTGEFMGSPSYISPEQAMARRVPLDHRTDIWSLGVTLYEFLTLEHPFESLTIELTLKNIVTHDPRPPRLLNPRLPKDVETIILKMLEKSPDDRYHRAGDVAADLRCVLNYEAIHARSHGAITRGFRFVRQYRVRLVMAALAVALVIVAGVGWRAFQNQERREMERHFARVKGQTVEAGSSLLDDRTLDGVQDLLRRGWTRSGSLQAAIDALGMDTIDEIKRALDQKDRPDALATGMKSLARLRAIHLHNPDRMERERMEKLDRAVADVGIRLVWEIADRLKADAPGAAAESAPEAAAERPEELWRWLCCFLGTADLVAGIKEKNPLVRQNALEAMATLDRYQRRFQSELQRLLGHPGLEPRVQKAAIDALMAIPGMDQDEVALSLLADKVRLEQRQTSFLVRHRIAQALRGSPLKARFKDVFEILSRDRERAVSTLATAALAEL